MPLRRKGLNSFRFFNVTLRTLDFANGFPFLSFLVFMSPLTEFSSIACLLFRRGPSAITWLVISIFIWIPIQCCTDWPRTHVLIKCFEAGSPFFAHCDAPSTVSIIPPALRVIASFFSAIPRSIFPTFGHTMSSHGDSPTTTTSISVAAAAARITIKKVGRIYRFFFPAITFANPISFGCAFGCFPDLVQFKYGEISETSSS